MLNRLLIFTCSLFFVILSQDLVCQSVVNKNYIPNGSFENFKKKSGNISAAIPWKGIATVDYYQHPLSNDTSKQKGARTGDSYAGLRYQKKYKEFLEVKLAEPLHRGYKYEITYYIRLAFWSNALLKSIGCHFSKAGYKGLGGLSKSNTPDSVCKKGGFINGYQWLKVSDQYIADGGEKFVTIGNFSPNLRKDMIKLDKFKFGFKEAYYFVDDISLQWIKPKEDDVKIVYLDSLKYESDSVLQVTAELKVGEKFTLNNIHFEKAHSYITPESFSELNKLVQLLMRKPAIQVRINGHSDNSGSKHKNQKLSEERAKAVFEYLIGKGVQNKMYFKGFGIEQPVATNDTEEGKAKNRRVEFEIIKDK